MELQERRMVLRDAEQSRLQDSSRVWTSRKSTIPCGTWRAKNTLTLMKLKLNRAINASFKLISKADNSENIRYPTLAYSKIRF